MAQGDLHSDLVRLIQRLNRAEIDWDAENIADWLWFARYLDGFDESEDISGAVEDSSVVVTEIASEEPVMPPPDGLGLYSPPPSTVEKTAKTTKKKGIPFQTPTAPALRRTLAIGRSLRPLMRKVDSYTQKVLDEDATAEQTAEQRFCMTVVKPEAERWLEVALVVEDSASSFLWQEVIRDFKQVLERQGAFRTVNIWYLQTSAEGDVALYARRPSREDKQQPRRPKELIDPAGRRLILLASDCISQAWRSEALYKSYLQPWFEHGLLTIVQMLPSHFWKRTALSGALNVQLGSQSPGVLNQQLMMMEVPLGATSKPNRGIKIPVVTLDPVSLNPWGRMVAGFGESWASGVWFDEGWQSVAPSDSPTTANSLSAEKLVQRFNTTASPMARRLAGLMAFAPVSLPIIYLLQETMLPDSTPLHMAEVFMSGLIHREEDDLAKGTKRNQRSAQKVFEFVADVRDLLRKSVLRVDAETTLNRVSEYVGRRLGKSIYSFMALLLLEQELGEEGGTELLQFARITKQSLRQMGGGYAALVDALDNPIVVASEVLSSSTVVDYPSLTPLNFTTAQLVDGDPPELDGGWPQLRTAEFEIVTVSLEVVEEESRPTLEPFEFVVANIERKEVGLFRRNLRWEIKRKQAQGQRLIERLGDDVSLELAAIPGGTFVMGSPEDELERLDREGPQHEVTVPPFFMGRYPVTQAQWRAVAALPQEERELEPDPSNFKGDNRPVERVSWYDAVEFCQRLAKHTGRPYRLPSEAEWEYACRSGTTTPFYFGRTLTTELANYDGNYTYADGPKGEYREETTVVGQFGIANAFGLSDMHGNVWEWCADHWHDNYEGAPTDGSAWLDENKSNSLYVLRGGSWFSNPRRCRSAFRYYSPDLAINYIGFRVACAAPRAL